MVVCCCLVGWSTSFGKWCHSVFMQGLHPLSLTHFVWPLLYFVVFPKLVPELLKVVKGLSGILLFVFPVFFILLELFVWDRVSNYCPGSPHTQKLPACSLQVLRLQAFASTRGSHLTVLITKKDRFFWRGNHCFYYFSIQKQKLNFSLAFFQHFYTLRERYACVCTHVYVFRRELWWGGVDFSVLHHLDKTSNESRTSNILLLASVWAHTHTYAPGHSHVSVWSYSLWGHFSKNMYELSFFAAHRKGDSKPMFIYKINNSMSFFVELTF